MPRFEVSAFGETMLRLSVPSGERLTKVRQFDVQAGGAETNTLSALSSLGRRCTWVSGLPDNDLGQFVLRELAAAKIDTSAVSLKEGRIGTYYLEFAVPPRPINAIYDRANSAISHLTPDDIDWTTLLDTKVIHLTGITAAISETCYQIVLEACRKAKEKGVTICFDVNYRSKLWSSITAREKLLPILDLIDILICGEGDAATVFGFRGTPELIIRDFQTLSDAEHIVLTRSSKGSSTLVNNELISVDARKAEIVDRLGAGDAFAAGVIDGYLDGDLIIGMKRGSVLSALALTQHGDMIVTSRRELEALMNDQVSQLSR